ncbi:MAG: hypothetical protein ACI857_003074 [Arenicella sp.]|jgi:hypothetical protein
MTIKVNYNEQEFKKDFKNYMIYMHKRPLIEIVIGILVLLIFILINHLNIKEHIDFYPEIFQIGIPVLTVGVGILLLFEVVYLTIGLIDIHRKASNIPYKDESITFTKTHIEFTWKTHVFNCFWSSYKKAILLNNSVFLIPKSRKGMPVRINSNEVGRGGFKLTLDELQQRFKINN